MPIQKSLDQELLKRTEDLVRSEYERLKCWAHGWPHVKRVKENSVELAGMEKQDPTFCAIAAYCHDLGRVIEEEDGEVDTTPGSKNHSVLSIEPTFRILEEIGIKGLTTSMIVEAVTAHSYKHYEGGNPLAKILRDSDKGDALGPWSVLRIAKFHLGRDFVDTRKIIKNAGNERKIRTLADQTLQVIEKDEHLKRNCLKALNFTLEWYEKRMFDTPSAYTLFDKDIKYLLEVRKSLSS